MNALNALKLMPEVCQIFCATANPVEVVVGETAQGQAVLVVHGTSARGVESEDDVSARKALLRELGYKS